MVLSGRSGLLVPHAIRLNTITDGVVHKRLQGLQEGDSSDSMSIYMVH